MDNGYSCEQITDEKAEFAAHVTCAVQVHTSEHRSWFQLLFSLWIITGIILKRKTPEWSEEKDTWGVKCNPRLFLLLYHLYIFYETISCRDQCWDGVDRVSIESGSDKNVCWGVNQQLLNHKLLLIISSVVNQARKSSWGQVLGSLSGGSKGPWEPHRTGGAAGGEKRTI